MQNTEFVGTWKLISWEIRQPDGTIGYPMGEEAIGRLMYDSGGHVSVQVSRPGRTAFASADQAQATPEEAVAAMQGFFSYFGTYHVDAAAGRVTHRLEGCLFPNWVGMDQNRFYTFSGNQLTLTTPLLIGGQEGMSVVVWERAES